MSFNDVAIVSIKGNDYRIHFWYLSKNPIVLMTNSNLKDKKWNFINFLFTIYKIRVKQLIITETEK